MEKQKFKRGNLVKVLTGHPWYKKIGGEMVEAGDFAPEEIGLEAVINYSYAEKYNWKDNDSFSIVFMKDNSVSWREGKDLEFIEEGGEHLFTKAKDNLKQFLKESHEIWEKLQKQKKIAKEMEELEEKIGKTTSQIEIEGLQKDIKNLQQRNQQELKP